MVDVSVKKPNILNQLQASLDAGESLANISKNHFASFIKYNKGILLYKQFNTTIKRNWNCELHLHIGIPGSGKSHYVHSNYPDAYWLAKPTNNNLYYYGYLGEQVIVIDDFTGWIPFTELLTLCDKYPKKVNTCGNYAEIQCNKVFITSNSPWEDWYHWQNCCKEALFRRITSITNYDKKFVNEINLNTTYEQDKTNVAILPP